MAPKYLVFTLLSIAVDAQCTCLSCRSSETRFDADDAMEISLQEVGKKMVHMLAEPSHVDVRTRSQIAIAATLHVHAVVMHQIPAKATSDDATATTGVLARGEENLLQEKSGFSSPGHIEVWTGIHFDTGVKRTIRQLALRDMYGQVRSIQAEFKSIDQSWCYAATMSKVASDIRKFESELETVDISNWATLLNHAKEIHQVLHAIQAAQKQLKAVSVLKFGLHSNFLIAQELLVSSDQRVKMLGTSIVGLHLQFSQVYETARRQQFSRNLYALMARLKRRAQPFKSVADSGEYFNGKLVEFLTELEALQRRTLARFPAEEEINRSLVRVTQDMRKPTPDIKLLYTGFDSRAVVRYIENKERELEHLGVLVNAMSRIPADLVPFMGTHSEVSASSMSKLVKNFRSVNVGGNARLLGGEIKLYRSSAPYFTGYEEVIELKRTDIVRLRETGIKRILSLTYLGYSVFSRNLLSEGGIRWMELPVEDFSPPRLDQLKKAVAFLEDARVAGEDTLVHCGFGRGRTGTVIASYEVYKVIEAWERRHRTIMPYSVIMQYIAERSRSSGYSFSRHGIEGVHQEDAVRLYAAWLILGKTGSDVPRDVLDQVRMFAENYAPEFSPQERSRLFGERHHDQHDIAAVEPGE